MDTAYCEIAAIMLKAVLTAKTWSLNLRQVFSYFCVAFSHCIIFLSLSITDVYFIFVTFFHSNRPTGNRNRLILFFVNTDGLHCKLITPITRSSFCQ